MEVLFLTQNIGKCPRCSGAIKVGYQFIKCNDCNSLFKITGHGQTEKELQMELMNEKNHIRRGK